MEVDEIPILNARDRRQTLTTLLQSDNIDESIASVDRALLLLEQKIANAFAGIAQMVNTKYKEFIPDICASDTLLKKVQMANENLKSVEKSLSEMVSKMENDISDEDHFVVSRAEELRVCLKKLSILEEIESDFSFLWCHESEENPLEYAQKVAAVEEKLVSLSQKEADLNNTFTEKIYPLLREEVVMLREGICHLLNQYWDKLFTFSDNSEEFIMKILSESDKEKLGNHFEAMHVLNTFDGKLAKLSKSLLAEFCTVIMLSSNVELSHNKAVGLARPASQYIIKASKENKASKKIACNVELVFKHLKDFFTFLFDDLGEVKVKGVKFLKLLFEKMSVEFINVLLHDCIATNASNEIDSNAQLTDLKTLTFDFLTFLQEKGYINDVGESFAYLETDLDVIFNNRHCTEIIVEARNLISSPYVELKTVGFGNVDERETMEEVRAECAQIKYKTINRGNFPRLLRFAKCQVSKSTVELIELVRSTILSAAKTESEEAAGRLVQTARNAVQLFICIAPRHHQTQISSVPQIAAVFYNNCYYICHCLMTLPVDMPEKDRIALQDKRLAITFIDFLPALRQLAADSLEKHLVQCRRQIASLLSDNQVFVNLDEAENLNKCEETLNACSLYLTQISNVWRNVFSNTVFAKALGNLVAFLFNSIIRIVFATKDIKADDAELSAKLIARTVTRMEKLFLFEDLKQSSIHRFAEREYFRIKEIIFCLNASLQDIFDRWCGGKGPLADCLQSKELRHLVEALFQPTAKRENVLRVIG